VKVKSDYTNGEWVIFEQPVGGNYTGHIRKRNGRWWFFGDVCRNVKGRVSDLIRKGGSIRRP